MFFAILCPKKRCQAWEGIAVRTGRVSDFWLSSHYISQFYKTNAASCVSKREQAFKAQIKMTFTIIITTVVTLHRVLPCS